MVALSYYKLARLAKLDSFGKVPYSNGTAVLGPCGGVVGLTAHAPSRGATSCLKTRSGKLIVVRPAVGAYFPENSKEHPVERMCS